MQIKPKLTKCRVTGEKIPILYNFGKMPIANNFTNSLDNKNFYEMKVAFNKNNGIFQLIDSPKPKKLFHKNYAFLSSTSDYMKLHFQRIAKELKPKKKNKDFSIMEIGCNDGIFLQNFKNFRHLGVEPSKNVYKICKSKKLNVINSFFNMDLVKKKKLQNKYDIIFAANVICHIPNINSLFQCVEKCLKDDGIFVFEEPYLGSMIEKTSYDQIYDEHYYMFSANSINSLIQNTDLRLFNAKKIPTHGGSMRYYLKKTKSSKKNIGIKKIMAFEKKLKITKISTMKKFILNCIKSRDQILNTIKLVRKKNFNIYGYGATSKSTTILHFCNIDNKAISGIFDTSPTKINKFFPGKNIKIIDYKNFSKIKPKYCILFAWNHYKEIFNKERKNKIKWICHINKKHFPKKFRNNFL